MQVALIQPEYHYSKRNIKITAITPPLSLLSLHKDADIYDLNVQNEPNYNDYDIVGITAMSINHQRSFEIFRKAKQNNCITVMGGIHASSLPEETLRSCRDIDVIVRGEGEETFNELVPRLMQKNLKINVDLLNDVSGISFLKNDKIIHTKSRPLVKNIDTIISYYNKIDLGKYRLAPHHSFGAKHTQPYIAYMTSRGCPYKCTFCASKIMWGQRVRFKSANRIEKEINFLIHEKNIKNIDFYDDTFMLHPEFNQIIPPHTKSRR